MGNYNRKGPTGTGRPLRPGILSKEEAKLQGGAMLARRVMNTETMAEIGKLFNLSPQTVSKRLSEARTGDLNQLARDIITERMLPKALSILDTELNNGSWEAAKEVLKGTQVLQTGGKATIEHISSQTPMLDQIRKEQLKAVDAVIVSEMPKDDNTSEG